MEDLGLDNGPVLVHTWDLCTTCTWWLRFFRQGYWVTPLQLTPLPTSTCTKNGCIILNLHFWQHIRTGIEILSPMNSHHCQPMSWTVALSPNAYFQWHMRVGIEVCCPSIHINFGSCHKLWHNFWLPIFGDIQDQGSKSFELHQLHFAPKIVTLPLNALCWYLNPVCSLDHL